jgi:5-methylcytosine-specific restriction endonuclease McrA
VHTGDGIERVSDVQSYPALRGGEGGSVLQALGSNERKKKLRKSRRDRRKTEYSKYLESPTWKKIRAQVLKRDGYRCRACRGQATVVHHRRYPMKLGEERLEWLFSMCAPCHDTIHAIKGMTLREATDMVLGGKIQKGNITYLADDPRLSEDRTRSRQSKKKKRKKPQARLRQVPPAHVAADERKKRKIEMANDELHAVQKRAKENRQARIDAIATRQSIVNLSSAYGFNPRSTS